MKTAIVALTALSFALSGCSATTPSSKPIWEVMKEEEAARARTLGPNSIRPQDNPFPPAQPVWPGSRPN